MSSAFEKRQHARIKVDKEGGRNMLSMKEVLFFCIQDDTIEIATTVIV